MDTPKPCWICGVIADSGEHMIKRSDLKDALGGGPYRFHTAEKRNTIMQGPNAKIIKSFTICAKCNNQLSQPYDKAWETFSKYLQASDRIVATPGNNIKLKNIFPGKIHDSMLFVHLFFVKLFGCRIAEENIPINLDLFSKSFLSISTQ